MTSVEIATRGGMREVDAEVYGRFAVTPFTGYGGYPIPRRGMWRVTHVPTGRAVNVPGEDRLGHFTKATARRLAKALDAELPVLWDLADMPPLEARKQAGTIVRRVLGIEEPTP